MKYFFVCYFSFLFINSYSQEKLDEWTLSPYLEINYQNTLQFSPGLRYRYLVDCPACPPIGAEFQLGTDLNFKKNNNFNIRFEASAYYILMLGITSQYWNTNEGNFYTLGPKTGINLYAFEINYSYNFHLTTNTSKIGKSRIGFKIDLETVYLRIKNGS